MEESYKKVARILRTDKDYIGNIEKRFEVITGKKGMIDKILEENSNLVKDRLLKLGVSSGADVKTIYDALISKIESDDKNVFELLGQPNCRVGTDCQGIGEVAKKIVKPPTGFFLKLDKAQEFLAKEPPKRVMKALGYKSVEKMLQDSLRDLEKFPGQMIQRAHLIAKMYSQLNRSDREKLASLYERFVYGLRNAKS